MAAVHLLLLVVEDDAKLARSMGRFLTQRGFVVRLTETEAGALEVLDEATPDAVLLDVHLPDGSGLDVLEHLRQGGAATPAIVMTANDSLAVRQRAEQLGVAAFLTKPVQPLELLRILQQALQGAA
jgi:two-component system response regulator HydG